MRALCVRAADLLRLPVAYYHLVFTLPHGLNGWAQLHPAVLYDSLFAAAAGTLKAFAADPKRLGGELGFTEGVVYAKPGLGHTEVVVGYLARYSHRIAISNARILGIDGESVAFRYTDYADGHRAKVMHLAGVEFVRRFLLHVLPAGFMRIRHYGFLANRCRRAKLARIGACLACPEPSAEAAAAAETEPRYPCPACGTGVLRPGALLPATALSPPRRESG